MPLYEFQCLGCKTEFEELVRNAEEKVECPKCGKSKVKRLMSKVAFKCEGSSMRTTAGGGGSGCSTCRPGPSGCSGCGG
jgi:putative FmdB family regulatory protein